ncbi:DUF397 domain-containing protein [Actinomadura rupiterrae]|uniref:DUF397 domain-containing protein n=1 Tax=Actinomadura rupiterrae TaxID=559627 RepID=UPI0020A24909|nr:DUF397 domain-containing protein [Actinomadura rupiterrae]MCP2335580.1 hypothetical protein [Actinomadura rupiterrae]
MLNTLAWKKSSRCAANGACVEVAATGPLAAAGTSAVAARDAKIGDASPVLLLSAAEWGCFLTEVKSGALDTSA